MTENNENNGLSVIMGAISVLDTSMHEFVTKIGSPLYIAEAGRERFRYPRSGDLRSDALVVETLKAVRVVSGLNSLIWLLNGGFTQEMGVILRTIDDFLSEIEFVGEIFESDAVTADQERFIEVFFTDGERSAQERLKSDKGANRVPKKSIYASHARVLGYHSNPDRVRRLSRTINEVLSGYAHGDYSQVMELYAGGSERFRTSGMLGTPRIPAFQRQIAIYVHRALNVFGHMALRMGLLNLGELLLRTRKEFEGSVAYPGPGI